LCKWLSDSYHLDEEARRGRVCEGEHPVATRWAR
jgi:hypothetical protein